MDENKKKKVIDDESLDQVTGGESSDAPHDMCIHVRTVIKCICMKIQI